MAGHALVQSREFARFCGEHQPLPAVAGETFRGTDERVFHSIHCPMSGHHENPDQAVAGFLPSAEVVGDKLRLVSRLEYFARGGIRRDRAHWPPHTHYQYVKSYRFYVVCHAQSREGAARDGALVGSRFRRVRKVESFAALHPPHAATTGASLRPFYTHAVRD